MDGPTAALVPTKTTKWTLVLAAVSGDGVVCVVGRGRDVTVGVVEAASGRVGQPFTTSLKHRGKELLSSCLCRDKILLLCKSRS